MFLYSNNTKGEFYHLMIFLKKRNVINQMPDRFFEFTNEFLSLEPNFNCRLPESTLEKLERCLIANFHHAEYLRLKSNEQSRYNDWNTMYFEVAKTMETYKKNEQRKQIATDRELRRMARKNKAQ